jgi:hypothetical protein
MEESKKQLFKAGTFRDGFLMEQPSKLTHPTIPNWFKD